jgi:hypothetical protein
LAEPSLLGRQIASIDIVHGESLRPFQFGIKQSQSAARSRIRESVPKRKAANIDHDKPKVL